MENVFEQIVTCSEFSYDSIKIVIPALNEEMNLKILLGQLLSLGFYDIVVIDGNSIDNTLKIAKDFGVTVLLQKGKGKGDAIRQAFRSISFDFDLLVMIDADGSMDPREIPSFVDVMKNSDADIVKGSRFLDGAFTHDMSPLRMFGNTIFNGLVNLLCSTNYSDLCYGFLAFNKKSVKLFSELIESDGFEVEAELLVKAKQLDLKVVEVPSIEYHRNHGESNLCTFSDGLAILRTILTQITHY
jgi:glycosyltransferase involved in cell wall biosynthesis